jgi:8-oxo-dGTP pyrophosphatase MutT (NUDIX family)
MKSRARASKLPAKSVKTEPDFVMLLAEPEIRLLMRADNVDEAELLALLRSVSVRVRENEPEDRKGPGYRVQHPDMRKYRRGVGIMLINKRSEIFIARRNDVAGAWQMPQGGIERRETPAQAAYRELKEEIGTDNAKIIGESAHWLYYALPEQLAIKAWGGRWKGQRQKWFVMRFDGEDTEINLATSHPEFDAWRWAPARELESLAVSFKRRLYVSLLREFAEVFRN